MTNQSWSWTPTESRVNPFALWSAILAVIVAPVALVLSILALRRIRFSGERGQELAIASLMISSALVAGAVLIALTYLVR